MTRETASKQYAYYEYGENDHKRADAQESRSKALDTDLEAPWELNLQCEGEQTGLDATTTGVRYESNLSTTIPQALLDANHDVYLEAATTAAGTEVVDVEIYDESTSSVVDSVSIDSGGQSRSGSDVSGSLNGGNQVHVRWNVTTTNGSGTFDAHGARLVVE